VLVNSADASVNVVDAHHSTPLSWASKRPSAACIDVLLHHNASPNIADVDGRTALIHAALAPSGAERDASILLLVRATGLLDLYIRQARCVLYLTFRLSVVDEKLLCGPLLY